MEKFYLVREDQLIKISELFNCLEDTIKEIIRNSDYNSNNNDLGPVQK